MNTKGLNDVLRRSCYGLFCNIDGKDQFLDENNQFGIEIEREIDGENIFITNINVINNLKKSIKLYSALVADLKLQNYYPDKILENAWTQSGFSGYRNGINTSKKKKLFLLRDQNPFSFRKAYGYIKGAQVSEWYTELVKQGESLVIGAISIENQFSQIFVKKEKEGTRVRVTCQFDGLTLEPGASIRSEKIAIIFGEVRQTLEKYADLVKRENKINHLPKPIKGLCCAYYYQGNYVNEKYIKDEMDSIVIFPKKLTLELVQIDGVPAPWGDWEDSWSSLFPGGLEAIARDIKRRGYMAGIWIAPYVASPKSKLFQNHPDWFLRDGKSKFFEARLTTPFDFISSLSFRALDPTHPGVKEFISGLFRKLKLYGFEYFKIDFTYPVCFANNFYKNVTRAQALREGFEIIRNSTGKNALIQSCITQMSPLVGLIDYCRVGLDTLNPFVCKVPILNGYINNYMLREDLRNCESRNFWHKKIWINDPDCVIFRSGTGISISLINKHKDFTLRNSTSLWIGDNIAKLTEGERTKLYDFVNFQ